MKKFLFLCAIVFLFAFQTGATRLIPETRLKKDLKFDNSIDVSVNTGDSYRVKYDYVKIFADYLRVEKPKYISSVSLADKRFLDEFFYELGRAKNKREKKIITEKYQDKIEKLFKESQKSQRRFNKKVLFPFVKKMIINKYLIFLKKHTESSFVPEAKLKLVEFYGYTKNEKEAEKWADDIIKNHSEDILYEIKREKTVLKLYTSGRKTTDIAEHYKSQF